jgi:hypothetical protein
MANARTTTRAVEDQQKDFHFQRSVEPSARGVEEAGAATIAAMMEWGLATFAERGERVATVLVSWLARNDHAFGKIYLYVTYNQRNQELLVTARDGGSMLPVFDYGDMLRDALADAGDLNNGAEYITGGRQLWCVLGPLRPWSVRYTWRPNPGVSHPSYTYHRCETRADAERAAATTTDRSASVTGVVLRRIEFFGPGDETWTGFYERPDRAW